jgi:hypothetical protein
MDRPTALWLGSVAGSELGLARRWLGERFEIVVPEETELVVRSHNVTLASEGDEVEVEGKYFQMGQLMVTSLKIMMSKPLAPPPPKGRRPAEAN